MQPFVRIFIFASTLWVALGTIANANSERVALVLGMADYQAIEPLDNTLNDANRLAETLTDIGFDVTLGLDKTAAELREMMEYFAFRSETADLALIYFAGHGIEVQGENFLIPVDARPRNNREVQEQSVSLQEMLKVVENARKMRIVILDSCRNNPLGGDIDFENLEQKLAEVQQPTDQSSRGTGGLAPADPDRGTLVAFAARDGQVALDGTTGNSPYARALIEKIAKPGLEISLMFRQVRDAVLKETGNLQEPHTYGSLSGIPFYLSGTSDGGTEIYSGAPEKTWSKLRPDQESQLLAMAELGDARSMLGLAFIRLNPEDNRFNPAEAVSFLEDAASRGSPEAQMQLAKLYEQGLGVDANPARALELYQAAAAQNHADAVNDLGFLTYYGQLGLQADTAKALALFGRAADLRHPQALFNYAALIDDGKVQGKGPVDAGGYLYKALRTGSPDVLDVLLERPTMFKEPTRKELQRQLKNRALYTGSIDGDIGPGTKRSIKAAYGLNDS